MIEQPIFLEGTDGILLGAMEDIDYSMKRMMLVPGDGLLLYSDGVTEAMAFSSKTPSIMPV